MPTLTLPQTGKSVGPATVLRWRKKSGATILQGEVLLEIETDEGLATIESPVAGMLHRIIASKGQTIAFGAPLAVIGEETPLPAISAPNQPTSPKPMSNPTASSSKVIPILMPKAGQSMEEGVLVKWHVQPGAEIQKGATIFEVETDKATMEVEATDSGRLSRIVVQEGASSPVLQPVAYLAEDDAAVDAFISGQGGTPVEAGLTPSSPLPNSEESQASFPARASITETGRVKASPAARKLAGERGVDLASVARGSGPGGRILSPDVPSSAALPPVAQVPVPESELPPGVVRKRMSGMRKAIARNLTLSKTTIPHWYLRRRIDAGALMGFYRSQKAKVGCSVNDVVVMACAKAIMEFPAMHSRVHGESILEFPGANIGIAVGMDEGLVVPVVMNAEKLTLVQMAAETKRLANQARAGKIENMGQGIFTISNLGMYGADDFVAIVNPPEASILGVGAVHEDVIVKDGTIRAGQTMNLTLSADHRLIDGTLGAQFMARLKALLEEPLQLIA